MKKLFSFAVLFLMTASLYAQTGNLSATQFRPGELSTVVWLSRTNYTNTTGDTTTFFSIKGFDYVEVIGTATDSVEATFAIDSKNSLIGANLVVTVTDSLKGASDSFNSKRIKLRLNGTDNIDGQDLIRVRLVNKNQGQGNGTTAGRIQKVFIILRRATSFRP